MVVSVVVYKDTSYIKRGGVGGTTQRTPGGDRHAFESGSVSLLARYVSTAVSCKGAYSAYNQFAPLQPIAPPTPLDPPEFPF